MVRGAAGCEPAATPEQDNLFFATHVDGTNGRATQRRADVNKDRRP